jgi:TatD DNase family protein
MIGLVDTHAHLMDPAFDTDRDAVYARAREAGLTAMILVGYDLPSSRAAVALADELPDTWATVGIHPNSASEASDADFELLAELAHAPSVVGIGETGLDYYRQYTPPERQRQAFEWHLDLAHTLHLPVIVHNRQADADVALVATAYQVSGVLHCFSSADVGYLDRMLEAGYAVSFAGPLTFKNASATRAMAARVPYDRLLVETDCPYLAPEPHRGHRNEPAFVSNTAHCLAEVVRMPIVTLVDTLWANCLRVFPALYQAGLESSA